jgi:adenylate cyclase
MPSDPTTVSARPERKLAAILAADVVGYSVLMGRDEEGTHDRLRGLLRDVIRPAVDRHRGRIVKTMGDGLIAEFASAVNAMQCAIELQHGMAAAGANLPESRRIVLRIGVNLGDVMIEESDLYGDGVNIAARLESIAEPGGIVVSGTAFDQIKNKVDAAFEDLGPQTLKNIAEAVRAYRVTGPPHVSIDSPKVTTDKPSIAVLPFVNMSGDPDQEYFSDGVTEEIIAGLCRFHELFVIARTSSFVFKGRLGMTRDIASELGVKYIVEGSVRKLADKIRVTVQLLDATAASQLWAERYDRDLEDIFAVQDDVTRTIVAKVMGHVIQAAHDRALHASPEYLLAFDCWLRGQHQLLLWTRESELDALKWFAKALDKDPHFARAHSSIALLLNAKVLMSPGYPEEAADRSRALRHARLSVEYDNEDARSHLSLAWVSIFLSDITRAKRHFQLAEDLNPNAADTIMNCAVAIAYLGEAARGKVLADKAISLNPLHADWYYYMLAQIHFLLGEFEQSFEIGHPYIGAFPELSGWTTAALGVLGREGEAMVEGRQFLKLVEDFWVGREPMSPETAVAWFLSVNHYLRHEDKRLVLRGLQCAGLPRPSQEL